MTSFGPVSSLPCSLAFRLEKLSEWSQRAVVFGEVFSSITPEEASVAYSRILAEAFGLRGVGHRILAQSATLSILISSWDEEHRIYTREAAAAQGDELTTVFLVSPQIPSEDDDNLEVPDYRAGRPLSLGERKTLATQPDRGKVSLAMRDPHPSVASRVLDNPTLTEDDVVRIAARRPQAPSVLAQIAVHTRWRLRPRVAMALVNNPGLPTSTALCILPFLGASDARQVEADNRISEQIREGTRLLLEKTSEIRKLP